MLGNSATGCGCGGLSDLGLRDLRTTSSGYENTFNPSQTYGSLQGATDAASMGVGVLVAIGLIAWAATGFKGL